jgi:hypothetical protein
LLNLPAHFSWRDRLGKMYLLADYSYIPEDQLADKITEGSQYIHSLNGTDILLLLNFEGTASSKQFMALFLNSCKMCEPNVTKTAAIGVNKPKILFIKMIKKLTNINLLPFSNQKLALDWLFQD